MFAKLKNQIREETGNDVSLIVNSNQPKLLGKGRQSRTGSTSSLGSFTIDGTKEEPISPLDIRLADGKTLTQKEFKKLESKEEEWRRKLLKKDEEMLMLVKKTEDSWKIQLETKDKDWSKKFSKKENEHKKLQEEKKLLLLKISQLEEEAKKAADYQQKAIQYQEDIDQLEGFQTQEMAKIKHLLLESEQKLSDKDKVIKENLARITNLKVEVSRLRKLEEDLENTQDELETRRHNFDIEKTQLSSTLAEKEEDIRHLKDRVAVLEQRSSSECVGLGGQLTIDERVQALLNDRKVLETRLEEAHLHLSEIKSSWSGKITALETQVERLNRQASEESGERRRAEMDRDTSNARITELEEELEKTKIRSEAKDARLDRLKKEREETEEQLNDVKSNLGDEIRRLQQSLNDTSQSRMNLEEKLQEKELECVKCKNENEKLKVDVDSERERCLTLNTELVTLKDALNAEKAFAANANAALARERREKDEMMMRNAQVSQDVELVKQELREQSLEATELNSRLGSLEKSLVDKDKEMEKMSAEKQTLQNRIKELECYEKEKQLASSVEHELKTCIARLEGEIVEKNKSTKILQQRLNDMRKTLQRELKIDPGGPEHEAFIQPYSPAVSSGSSSAPVLTVSNSQHHTARSEHYSEELELDNVNFKYLKHVLIKFLTSREYEAQHLTRAVATLLRFSAEEEKLVKETLEWKMSWFGTRPNLGNGQTSKTIPPS